MTVRGALVSLGVVVSAAACVGLGFWQLSRWEHKRALNATSRAALAREPVVLHAATGSFDDLRGHRVTVTGRYDESRQVLLHLRPRDGETGVEVATPLRLEGESTAVLVLRGWLPSEDGAHARPQDFPEPGERTVTGVLETIARGGAPVRTWDSDSVRIISARDLELDALASHFPYALAPALVRELPGPGVPGLPARRTPAPLDEGMHLGYAIQWFVIAAIVAGGSAALAWSRRQRNLTSTAGSGTT
jgi:surfeit locus 1 family protein